MKKFSNIYVKWASTGLYALDIYIDAGSAPIYRGNGSGTNISSDDIQSIQIATNNQILPISLFTKQYVVGSEPRFIDHNLQSALLIKADLIKGANDDVIAQLQPRLSEIAMQYGISIDLGGEQAESSAANVALLQAFPVRLLGLMGIVVNNGIVLIECMLLNIKKRQSLRESIVNAFTLRFHAVLLSSLTTIVGMLSLAFLSSRLWPPLA